MKQRLHSSFPVICDDVVDVDAVEIVVVVWSDTMLLCGGCWLLLFAREARSINQSISLIFSRFLVCFDKCNSTVIAKF